MDWTATGLRTSNDLARRCEILRRMQRDRLLMVSDGPDADGRWNLFPMPNETNRWFWSISPADARRTVDRPVANGVFRDHGWYAFRRANADTDWDYARRCIYPVWCPWLWTEAYGRGLNNNFLGWPVDPALYLANPATNTFLAAWKVEYAQYYQEAGKRCYHSARTLTPEWFATFYRLLKQCGETVLAGRWDDYKAMQLAGPDGAPASVAGSAWTQNVSGEQRTDFSYAYWDSDMHFGEWLGRMDYQGQTFYDRRTSHLLCPSIPLFRPGKPKAVEIWILPESVSWDFALQPPLVAGQWHKLREFSTTAADSGPFEIGPDGADPLSKPLPELAPGQSIGWTACQAAVFVRHQGFDEYGDGLL